MTNDRILLIRTGGTIDAAPYADALHPPSHVTTLKGDASPVLQLLPTLSEYERLDAFTWLGKDEQRFVKDSQEFTPADIAALADLIRADDHPYVLLTHGTDAMAKNAAELQAALAGSGKTVAFVGAMVPISMSRQFRSEGWGNLQYAMAHLAEQPHGTYLLARHHATQRIGFFDPSLVEKERDASLTNLAFTVRPR